MRINDLLGFAIVLVAIGIMMALLLLSAGAACQMGVASACK